MKPQIVFSFLRVSTNILYYLMIVLAIIVICSCLTKILGFSMNKHEVAFNHEVMAFGENRPKPVVVYSADSTVNYVTQPNRFTLNVEPNSPLGYFSFYLAVVGLVVAIVILGLFRKIFNEKNLFGSFVENVYRRLVILAIIFAASDVVTLINYFIFNSLLRKTISVPYFEQVTKVGSGILTGLIIYAIAIIYQRGLSLQEENELTV